MEGYVKWWNPQTGNRGQIKMEDLERIKGEFRADAIKTLNALDTAKVSKAVKKISADHIIYCTTIKDKAGNLEQVRFYRFYATKAMLKKALKNRAYAEVFYVSKGDKE